MSSFLIRGACLSACALLSFMYSAPSVAEDAARVLTLRDALTKTLERNPDLKAFGFEIEAQAGRIQQAGARPSPEVGLSVENAFGSGARSGLEAAERVREAELRLAEMRRRPPWHVTAGVRRFEDAGDHAFIVGLTVPLGSRDFARGAISEARANAAGVHARGEALRVQLDAELFALYQELRHAYAEVTTLDKDVLPRMEEAEQQSRYAYERGRYGYVEWAAAQRELLDARRALLEASAGVHRHRIEIERLTGGALTAAILP